MNNVFKNALSAEDLEYKRNVERERARAIELARQLCEVFDLHVTSSKWGHDNTYVISLAENHERSYDKFEICTNGKKTWFKDDSRTGLQPRCLSFLPSELRLDNKTSYYEREPRAAWEQKAKEYFGVDQYFAGNCGYGPHVYLRISIDNNEKLIVDLLKAHGVKLRLG